MKNHIIFVLIGFIAIVFLLFTSIEAINKSTSTLIEIEAENANTVIDPIKIIKIEGASNNQAIKSSTTYGIYEGKATYEIEFDESGDYYFWGRCYWQDPCSNSFIFSIDKKPVSSFGQNPILGKWHWVNLNHKVAITKGKHNIVIGSLEARSIMDKFILTKDKYYTPTDGEFECSHFIDFKEGIPSFLNLNEEYKYASIIKIDDNESLLFDNDSIVSNPIILNNPNKHFYTFRMIAKSYQNQNSDSHFRMYFNYIDENNNNYLEIINKQIRLSKVISGKKVKDTLLIQYNTNVLNDKWITVSLSKANGIINFNINGKTIHSLKNKVIEKGNVGFSVIKGKILTDNIALFTNNTPFFNENFHAKNFDFTKELPEHSSTYIEKVKGGFLSWLVMKGDWSGIGINNEKVNEAIHGKLKNKEEAITVLGDEFWSDYTFGCAIRPTDETGLGLCFYVQDSCNYYMFKWVKNNSKWIIQLVKIENDNEVIIHEKEWAAFNINMWYKLEVKLHKELFFASIDDNVVIKDTIDNKLLHGKVGFWNSSPQGVYYDDVYIKTSNNEEPPNLDSIYYSFEPNQHLGIDFSNWIPSNTDMIKHFQVNKWNAFPFINKQFLKEPYLVHKKYITSNFIISQLNTENIPKDVNICFRFNSNNNNRTNSYKIFFEKNKSILLKNDVVISTSNEFSKRDVLEISHMNDIWNIKNNNTSLIQWKDEDSFDSTNFIIGYEGIGKALLQLNPIIIKEIGK